MELIQQKTVWDKITLRDVVLGCAGFWCALAAIVYYFV